MSTAPIDHLRLLIATTRVAGEKYLAAREALLEAERDLMLAEDAGLTCDLDRYEQGGAHETDCGIAHHRALAAVHAAQASVNVTSGLVTDCQRAVSRGFAAFPWPKP